MNKKLNLFYRAFKSYAIYHVKLQREGKKLQFFAIALNNPHILFIIVDTL